MVSILISNILQKEIILDGTELRNYEGEDLSSINDFRDNSIQGYQYITKENYKLKITGLVEKPQNYSYNETINLFPSYKEVITLYCVEGWDVKMLWEGVLVKDILETAEIPANAHHAVIELSRPLTPTWNKVEYLQYPEIAREIAFVLLNRIRDNTSGPLKQLATEHLIEAFLHPSNDAMRLKAEQQAWAMGTPGIAPLVLLEYGKKREVSPSAIVIFSKIHELSPFI